MPIRTAIERHPAWKGGPALNEAGLDLDAVGTFRCFDTRVPGDVTRLKELGVGVEGGPTIATCGIRICLDEAAAKTAHVSLFPPKDACDSLVVLYPGCTPRGKVHLGPSSHLVVFGPSFGPNAPQRVDANLFGPNCALVVGNGATAASLSCAIEGPDCFLLIGQGAMLSSEITAYCTDYHSIISLESGMLLNRSADILIGRHVWMGAQSMVLKGVTVGRGCIVGARALVTADVPEFSLAAGNPARIVRSQVSWTRRAPNKTLGRTWAMQPDLEFKAVTEPAHSGA